MIRIINFDVGQADCFLLHFENDKKYFNLLIDGAYQKNEIVKILEKYLSGQKIQGIVVTHVDRDHISGIKEIVRKRPQYIKDAFFLFNKYDESLISYRDAKVLADDLKKFFPMDKVVKSYSRSFSQKQNLKLNEKSDQNLELQINLMSKGQRSKCEKVEPDVVNITVLGPDIDNISKFMRNWHDNNKDSELTNRVSICLLVEFDNKKILMSGDGYLKDMEVVLEQIGIDKLDVIKAPHHGAKENNSSLVDMVNKYKCSFVLFTIDLNKDKEGKHPDIEVIKKLKENQSDVKLYCNTTVDANMLEEYIEQKTEVEL